MMKNRLLGVAVAFVSLAAPWARGDVTYTYDVTWDTTALTQNLDQGAFYVDFQYGNSSGFDDNTATISNFSLGSGSVTGTGESFSNSASPDLTGSLGPTTALTIDDSGAPTDFNQAFTPGSLVNGASQMAFTLDLNVSPNSPSSSSPDVFVFQVFSNVTATSGGFPSSFSGNPINPVAYLEFDISSAGVTVPALESGQIVPTPNPSGGALGNGTPTPAPVATFIPPGGPTPVVPEPSTLSLMAFGLVGLAARGRWRRKAAAD